MHTEQITVYDEVPTELLEPPRKLKPTKDQLLLADVERVFRRFMHFPHDHAHTMASLWVAHTHLRSAEGDLLPRITPRIYYGSKQSGAGKTTALELTTLMSYRGEMALEPTEPGLVTKLHVDKATVGITEIDLFFGSRGTSKQGHRAVINGGYKRGATVDRERNGEVEKRNIHGCMALDGKNARKFLEVDGPFDTLRTRSHAIILDRKPKSVKLDEYDSERHEKRLTSISTGLTEWGMRNGRAIVGLNVDPLLDDAGVHNRDKEIWRVLFQVAAWVGGGWLERVVAAARAIVLGEWGEEDAPQLSFAEELLRAAREAFTLDDGGFLPTRVLCRRLLDVDGWWREEWTSPRAASMSLAEELATFGIEAKREYVEGKQERGYALVELLQVDEPEYVEPEPAVTPVDEWDWDELDEE
jgi:hypothetical protein